MKRRRLDSDDDEDEYLPNTNSPLLEYAVPTQGVDHVMLEMGVASSSSPSASITRENSLTRHHDDDSYSHKEPGILAMNISSGTLDQVQRTAGAPEVALTATAETRGVIPSHQPDDDDIPLEWRGLLPDELLDVYAVPLKYLQANKPTDDKLLAQYLPYDTRAIPPIGGGHVSASYSNEFHIPPGWRWDGVVRGRSAIKRS